jgi:hypothetical protein
MASDDGASRFGRWVRQTASSAARAMGTPAGANTDHRKSYCPSTNGIPDFSGGGCEPLPPQGASGERR